MYSEDFENFFRKISDNLTLDLISENKMLKGDFPIRDSNTPIWDTIDSLEGCEYIKLENGNFISCKKFLRRPVRILFFIMLSEFESRIFRIHEWRGLDISELNDRNLKELIVSLLDSNLISLQKEYKTKREFKEDLKAISVFRNNIMHIDKKLEKETDISTIIKRKRQILRVLQALQGILDGMVPYTDKGKLTDKTLNELNNYKINVEDIAKKIYSFRDKRPLFGERSIFDRNFGRNFEDIESFDEDYVENSYNNFVKKTELFEAMKYMKEFDDTSSFENKLNLILEIGDILFQRKVVETLYGPSNDKKDLLKKFDYVLDFFRNELMKRKIPFEFVEELMLLKYKTRTFALSKGFYTKGYFMDKNKNLEKVVCKEKLKELEKSFIQK